MCGLLIHYSKKGNVDEGSFRASLALQHQRGPDNLSYIRINPNLIMGHTRLSIIDLSSSANQPMKSANENYIVFNGEIYNFQEIRQQLINEGNEFKTSGDTEVLLSYLDNSSLKGVDELNGMWAFGYYAKKSNELLISRDRFGKKPLYYYEDCSNLIISSEIKSIFKLTRNSRKIDNRHLVYFLNTNTWDNQDKTTFYEGINKVLPGESIAFNLKTLTREISHKNYLENYVSAKNDISELDDLIFDSVCKRLIADVPMGVFLSGGVDSSLVASYASGIDSNLSYITSSFKDKDNLFSHKFTNEFNVELLEVDLNEGSTVSRLKAMTKYFELPIPLLGISVGMNALYEYASSKEIKVMLDGTGGDEIFGGYYDYYGASFIEGLARKGSFIQLLSFFIYSFSFPHNIRAISRSGLMRMFSKIIWRKRFKKERINFVEENPFSKKKNRMYYPKEIKDLTSMQAYDIKEGRLQTWLQINDMNSMMYSVEARSPLLDYRLIRYLEMEEKYKISKGYNKVLLRELLARFTSSEIAWRKDKKGMSFHYEKFVEDNREMIFSSVKRSKVISKLFIESGNNKNFDQYFAEGSQEKDHLLCKCFAVSLLEQEYNLIP